MVSYRMGYDALSLVLEVRGEYGGHDTRGGAGENDVIVCQRVQFTEYLLLQGHILWCALL